MVAAHALEGGRDALEGIDVGAGEDFVQGIFVEHDRTDVGQRLGEAEHVGHEARVVVDELAGSARRQDADGLEVADVEPPRSQAMQRPTDSVVLPPLPSVDAMYSDLIRRPAANEPRSLQATRVYFSSLLRGMTSRPL